MYIKNRPNQYNLKNYQQSKYEEFLSAKINWSNLAPFQTHQEYIYMRVY